jgi:hypothetical protein
VLKFSVPPGYVRRKQPFRPKLDEFTGVIDAILASDREQPPGQGCAPASARGLRLAQRLDHGALQGLRIANELTTRCQHN